MPTDSRSWRMADRLAGGQLESILRAHATSGSSLASIARFLYADHGIEVSVTTLSKWVADLDVPETAA